MEGRFLGGSVFGLDLSWSTFGGSFGAALLEDLAGAFDVDDSAVDFGLSPIFSGACFGGNFLGAD